MNKQRRQCDFKKDICLNVYVDHPKRSQMPSNDTRMDPFYCFFFCFQTLSSKLSTFSKRTPNLHTKLTSFPSSVVKLRRSSLSGISMYAYIHISTQAALASGRIEKINDYRSNEQKAAQIYKKKMFLRMYLLGIWICY